MSEMDDVEFLERTVKNNKDFVAGQIASMKKDMKNQISTLEKKLKEMEEENHKIASMNKYLKNPISTVENKLKEMEEENHRLTREMPLQIKTVCKLASQDLRTLALTRKQREPQNWWIQSLLTPNHHVPKEGNK